MQPELISALRKKQGGIYPILRECLEFLIFACFIMLFTMLIITEPFSEYFRFEQSVRAKFERGVGISYGGAMVEQVTDPQALASGQIDQGPGSPFMLIEEVNSIESLWKYIDTTLYENIYLDVNRNQTLRHSMRQLFESATGTTQKTLRRLTHTALNRL
jgi:hypothetical protein